MVDSNKILYGCNEKPDHCVVIKYVPYVGKLALMVRILICSLEIEKPKKIKLQDHVHPYCVFYNTALEHGWYSELDTCWMTRELGWDHSMSNRFLPSVVHGNGYPVGNNVL